MAIVSNPLAIFIDKALCRRAEHGASLRAVARAANIAPSMLSMMRRGKVGVPLPRLTSIGQALCLDHASTWQFQRLVRSDQARRAVHRGTSYVAEVEAIVDEQRAVIGKLSTWLTEQGISLPKELKTAVEALMAEAIPPAFPAVSLLNHGLPWSMCPVENRDDWPILEARNDQGQVVMAEYRVHVRDAEGRLMLGDIIVALGINAALDEVAARYGTGQLGCWPAGWYQCDVVRKAAPNAYVCIAVEISTTQLIIRSS